MQVDDHVGVIYTMPTPTTLDEAILALDNLLGDEDRNYLSTCKDENKAAYRLHHSLGRHLRNEWGLWSGSTLAKHLREDHKVTHPDDMSHFVIVTYCRRQIPTRFERILR